MGDLARRRDEAGRFVPPTLQEARHFRPWKRGCRARRIRQVVETKRQAETYGSNLRGPVDMNPCPRCGAELADGGDGYCDSCRDPPGQTGRLPTPARRREFRRPGGVRPPGPPTFSRAWPCSAIRAASTRATTTPWRTAPERPAEPRLTSSSSPMGCPARATPRGRPRWQPKPRRCRSPRRSRAVRWREPLRCARPWLRPTARPAPSPTIPRSALARPPGPPWSPPRGTGPR